MSFFWWRVLLVTVAWQLMELFVQVDRLSVSAASQHQRCRTSLPSLAIFEDVMRAVFVMSCHVMSCHVTS
jgi:hypothetical protein